MNFIVNKTKAILSGATVIFFGGFGIYYLVHQMWLEALVFLALAIVFGFMFHKSASVITIDRQNIALSFFGKQRRRIAYGRSLFKYGK